MKNCTIVFLIFLFWLSATATLAQTPDLEQLKTKLQQLEQMMQDLRPYFPTIAELYADAEYKDLTS